MQSKVFFLKFSKNDINRATFLGCMLKIFNGLMYFNSIQEIVWKISYAIKSYRSVERNTSFSNLNTCYTISLVSNNCANKRCKLVVWLVPIYHQFKTISRTSIKKPSIFSTFKNKVNNFDIAINNDFGK